MSAFGGKADILLEDRPQVLQLVEEVPDVVSGTLLSVRMQVGDLWVVAVAVERRLGLPFDEDHYLARLDFARGRLAEFSERDDAPAVRLHFLRRAAPNRQILIAVCPTLEPPAARGLPKNKDRLEMESSGQKSLD